MPPPLCQHLPGSPWTCHLPSAGLSFSPLQNEKAGQNNLLEPSTGGPGAEPTLPLPTPEPPSGIYRDTVSQHIQMLCDQFCKLVTKPQSSLLPLIDSFSGSLSPSLHISQFSMAPLSPSCTPLTPTPPHLILTPGPEVLCPCPYPPRPFLPPLPLPHF